MLEVSEGNLEEEVKEGLVVVDFWGPGCKPCASLGVMLDALAVEYEERIRFVKINVEDCPRTTRKFTIRGLPTVLLFKDGKPVKQTVGLRSKAEMRKLLDSFCR